MRKHHSVITIPLLTRRAGLAAAVVCSTAAVSVAGIVGPGGDAHIWSGAVNGSWHIGGNWTNGQVPGAADAAVINGGPSNIVLNGDSATLASLFIAGGLSLSNNGFELNVTHSIGATTISGDDSAVFVTGAGLGFVTDTLEIESEGRLQLAGGHARVNSQLTLLSDASISGRGRLDVQSAAPAAFNGFNGEFLNASGGELEIRMNGGGGVALPPTVNIFGVGSSLVIDGPLFVAARDLNFNADDTELHMSEDWEITGALTSNPGGRQRITGAAMMVAGELNVQSGSLSVEAPVDFDFSSVVQVSPNAELIIADAHRSFSGHSTTVGMNGTLRINGTQEIGPAWGGDIMLSAGTLEVNMPQLGFWRMSGDLTLGSLFALRSHIAGDARIRLTGAVSLPGLGGEIDGSVDLRNGSSTVLGQPHTRLIINGSLIQREDANITGAGRIEIEESGVMLTTEPVTLGVDVLNRGEFGVRGASSEIGYAYINAAYTQEEAGRLVVQLGGAAPTERDVYETADEATLAGEVYVELVNDFMPMIGQSFEIFTANGGVNGVFDSVGGVEGFEASVVGDTVILTYVGTNACQSDINGDGVVNGADLASLLTAWGTNNPGADLNGDGAVDGADLAVLLTNWGACN